jgi:hypothetical protein
MINYKYEDFAVRSQQFLNAEPFNHIVLDNFLDEKTALAISNEFPAWDDSEWNRYENAIEKKKTLNIWDRFQTTTYTTLTELLGTNTVDSLAALSGITQLSADIGLSGGGLHCHKTGDKLNIHLDYSIHPKLKMERRLNIIIYVTPNWQSDWGGGLELWSHNPETNQPLESVVKIENKFNRAIIFHTAQNSWHGLPTPITCPEGIYRKSLATYYVSPARIGASDRMKALFAPMPEQKNDPAVLDLIKKRSSINTSASVYRKN